MSGSRLGAAFVAMLLISSCSGGSVSPGNKPAPAPQATPAEPPAEKTKTPIPVDDQAADEAREYVTKRYKRQPKVAAAAVGVITELEAALATEASADADPKFIVEHLTAYLDQLACWRRLDPKSYERDSENLLDRMLATPERYEAYLRAERHMSGVAYRSEDDPACDPKKAGGGA